MVRPRKKKLNVDGVSIDELCEHDPCSRPEIATSVFCSAALALTFVFASLRYDGHGVWLDLEQDPGYFCEGDRPENLVREPVNTGTTIFFWMTSFYQIGYGFLDCRDKDPDSLSLTKRWPWINFLFGVANIYHSVGTTTNHMTRSRIGHFLDVHGMFFVCNAVCAIQWLRLFANRREGTIVSGLSFLSGIVMVFVSWIPYNHPLETLEYFFVTFYVIQAAMIEIRLRNYSTYRPPWVFVACVVIVIGLIAQVLDRHLLCEPLSFWQLHGIWHFCAASALHCFYLHIRNQLIPPRRAILIPECIDKRACNKSESYSQSDKIKKLK